MDRDSVSQRNYSQNAIVKIVNSSPKSNSVVTLHFLVNCVVNDKLTPFLFQIGTLSQNFVFKVSRISVFGHIQLLTQNTTLYKFNQYGVIFPKIPILRRSNLSLTRKCEQLNRFDCELSGACRGSR